MIAHEVADLRWLLLSPSLLGDDAEYPCDHVAFSMREVAQIEHWLGELAADPAPLRAFLAASRPGKETPLRLGRYAERLLTFFLSHGPLHRLVAANIAIPMDASSLPDGARDHTTKGEIDFLLKSPTGQRLHWELAIKYFVARDVPAPTIDEYIGPDSSESFRLKVEKLVCRQVVQTPPPPYNQHLWAPQLLTRGQMFYRLGRSVRACSVLGDSHLRGFWIPFAALLELAPIATSFVVLDRSMWMAPRMHAEVMSLAELRVALQEHWQGALARRPQTPLAGIMIAPVVPVANMDDADVGYWQEMSRGFVMPG